MMVLLAAVSVAGCGNESAEPAATPRAADVVPVKAEQPDITSLAGQTFTDDGCRFGDEPSPQVSVVQFSFFCPDSGRDVAGMVFVALSATPEDVARTNPKGCQKIDVQHRCVSHAGVVGFEAAGPDEQTARARLERLRKIVADLGSMTSTPDTPDHVEPDEALDEPTEPELRRVYRWEVDTPKAESATLELSIGDVYRADGSAQLGEFAQYLSACEIDPQRDAVIPIRLTITNTTDGFDADFSATLALRSYSDIHFKGATQFSDTGPSCADARVNLVPAEVSFASIQPEASATQDWLLVLSGYYSAKHPDGMPDELANVRLWLTARSSGDALGLPCDGSSIDRDRKLDVQLVDPDVGSDERKEYNEVC